MNDVKTDLAKINQPITNVKKVKITAAKTLEGLPRTLIHGEPGIGKSTFAAAAPSVVFICTEDGTRNIRVRRARIEDNTLPTGERDPKTYDEFMYVLDSLIAGAQANTQNLPFQNVAIDTVDSLEKLIHLHLCKIGGKRSIADFTYGRGFDRTVDELRMVLARLEHLNSLGVGIILISHTKIETFNNPEGQNFDYFEVKCHKKIAGLLVEWSDNVLFAKREQYSLEEGGKVRGVGSGARFIYTQKTPTLVAKNRYDLPEKISLFWPDYQTAMDNHKPANPEELVVHAKELIEKLPEDEKAKAINALSKINENDARTLTQFVDYCRGKVNLTSAEKPNVEKEATND